MTFSVALFAASFNPISSVVIGQEVKQAKEAESKKSPIEILSGVKRIVFLGDSITYSGQYVGHTEFLVQGQTEQEIEFLNLGLPSETVSGLSEPGHAGGRFPRPDLHERLARILEQTKPDLVIANYGMNCGIYHPYSEDRFDAFRDGMTKLHDAVIASGARIVHVTPPVFDNLPRRNKLLPAGLTAYPKGYAGYDEVLELYSAWLLAKRGDGWMVVDAHGPMKQFMQAKREIEPEFKLSKDGVHINEQGHYLMARELVTVMGLGIPSLENADFAAFKQSLASKAEVKRIDLLKQRQRIRCDRWLEKIGHQRPGMKAGLSDDEANAKIAELDKLLGQ